ncbi:hypothetical protein Ahy_A04g017200 isoform F [Arachis hypogaea]|uniref:Heat shock cognate 70 kDa protein n=3 Tax=Arachis TaxID=3817 RepID=A0A445DA94_ARAHY|nr:hypothetical protein Ahy_A04g017200 isoform F [Arachis hypogaea]
MGEGKPASSVAIGIDLGTTYSCVAVWHQNRAEIIPNDQGNTITPSCVAFTDTQRMIGDDAKYQIASNPTNTVFDSKRLIGRKFSDPHVQNDMKFWPFLVTDVDDIPMIVVEHKCEKKFFTAEEITSMILAKMRQIAEKFLETQVKNAVITVPAYFNDSQRQATKDAGHIAGLNVMSILNEPSAAAIAYGLNTGNYFNHFYGIRTVFVFDLGGSTLDLTLLTIDNKGNITVKIHGGDTHLGGQDFDAAMVEFVASEFQRKKWLDLRGNKRAICRLKVACERAKRNLSSTTQASIEVESLHQGIDFYTTITRAKFEEINKNLFERCMELVHECFADSNTAKQSVDEVVLVGGSTRIPKLEQQLKDFFDGKDLCKKYINADEAVAYGAAIHASKLSGHKNEKIPRSTVIPTKKQDLFATTFDNQRRVTFHIYDGESKIASNNNLLGSFDLEVPPAPRGVAKINVCFEIDSNGILHVSAEEIARGATKKVSVATEEVERRVKDAEKYKAEVEEHRQKVEARNALQNLAYNMRNLIEDEAIASELSAEDKKKINKAIDYTLKWIDESDFATVDEFKKEEEGLLSVFGPIISKMIEDLDARGSERRRKRLKKKLEVAARIFKGVFEVFSTVSDVLQIHISLKEERMGDGKASSSVAIGIDLGTTYSCVAVWRNDRVEIITNDQGNRITPSCVAFNDTQRMIGDAAKNQIAANPTNTVFERMGEKIASSIAIGIDLGTTYSCVAVWRHDGVEIITNDQGNRITPSCVAFNDTQRMIGDAAKNQIAANPTNTVFDSKRLIGRKFSEPHVQNDMKLWPFQVTNVDEIPMIIVEHKSEKKSLTAEEISSMILAKMREIAEQFLGTQVTNAVITVPAYFNDSQRQATKDAGQIAGLNVLSILNEPSAAAIAYGLDTRDYSNNFHGIRTVFVFDFGGGTLDLTLLTIDNKGNITVKIHGGDTHLGGQDFDAAMVEFVASEFQRKKRLDLRGNKRAICRLKVACERAKRILSSTTQASIELESLHQGIDFYTSITRAKFEEINKNLFERCMELVNQCFADSNTAKQSVDEVVLVGGSTRIPKLEQRLKDFFDGKDLCKKCINADEAVAYGAAIHASKLSGDKNEKIQDLKLWEVTPLSLGVEVRGSIMNVIIPRNTVIPTKKQDWFTTTVDNQTIVTFHIYEGERKIASNNNLLGSFDLEVPPAPRGASNINVCFEVDSNGILHVSAEEIAMGWTKKVTVVSNKGRLSREEVERMVKDAEKYKAEDEEYRQMVSGKNKLEDLAYNMRNVIEEEPVASELSAEDKERINKAVDYALKLVDETDFITVDELVKVEKDLTVFYTTISKIVQDLDARGNESERKTLKKDRFKVGASFVNGLISSVCSVIQVIQNM